MRKKDVEVGATYLVKVSGNVVPVRLQRESAYGGWEGVSLVTGRHVRIRTAAKLRRKVTGEELEKLGPTGLYLGHRLKGGQS